MLKSRLISIYGKITSYSTDVYIKSLMIIFLYAFGFGLSIYLLPALLILFLSTASLINSMYVQKKKIEDLEDIRDFEYSIIISQSSDDDLISSIGYYLEHYKKDIALYKEIENLSFKLSNNSSLDNEIENLKISRELYSFLKVLSYTLSSGMDIKKVAILEYQALIKRIEAEKEIWASFSDKRLEVIIMIIMPPIIIFISKVGLSNSMQISKMIEHSISTFAIILICVSSRLIESIIGEAR